MPTWVPTRCLELDQELIISLNCTTCQTRERVLKPMAEVTFQAAHCSTCGSLREIEMTHSVTGKEDFLSHDPGRSRGARTAHFAGL